MTLSSYDYEIQYRQGSQQANADGCSRLPLPVSAPQIPIPSKTILVMAHLDTTPVAAKLSETQRDTVLSSDTVLVPQRDTVLSKVLQFVLQGWP